MPSTRNLIPWVLAVACAPFAGSACAQAQSGIQLRLSDELIRRDEPAEVAESAPVRTFGLPALRGLTLGLTVTQEFDDNVFRQETDGRSDFRWIAKPEAAISGGYRAYSARLSYNGEYGRYLQIATEDYYDQVIATSVDVEISQRLQAGLRTSMEFEHDPRGGVITRLGQDLEPDRWRRRKVTASLTYGRRIAKAQISAEASLADLRYLNNGQSIRSYDQVDLSARGRYNFSPRFAVLLKTASNTLDYVPASDVLDSTTRTYHVGVAWEATVKTEGEFSLGIESREFADPRREGTSGISWDGSVTWSPRSYSVVRAFTSRSTHESSEAGVGDASVSRFGVSWRHGFTERLTLETAAEMQTAEFGDVRADDILDLNAEVFYRLRNWLEVSARWQHERRASSEPGASYDDNVIGVTVAATLNR